ncbi:MAG: hypothetical protein ABEJ68_01865 [Halobacteriaceae archaeon]
MDGSRPLYWSGLYTLAWSLAAAIGLALLGGGYFLGIDVAIDMVQDGEPLRDVLETAAPGLAVAFLGLVVWRAVSAWAKYRTLIPAIRADLAETYDNERVKSEILSVLDERLSDMQQDLQGVQRELRAGEDDTDFEFD